MDNTTVTVIIFVVNIVIAVAVSFITTSLKIGEYKNKVDNLETTVGKDEHGGLRKTVGEINNKVISCETTLREREPLTKRKSPVSLTDRGEHFLNDSGGKKFIDDNFTELLTKINETDAKTAYDIQEASKEVLEPLREDTRLVPLKEYLFKDGSSLDDIFTVMSVYLRDKVLKEKQMDVKDVDTSDPHNNKK